MPLTASHTIHNAHSHFGWDNSFPPVKTIAPGEVVEFETTDASGRQLSPSSTVEDVANLDFGKINPVTGPIYVDEAEPGDAMAFESVWTQAVDLQNVIDLTARRLDAIADSLEAAAARCIWSDVDPSHEGFCRYNEAATGMRIPAGSLSKTEEN